MPLYKKRSTQPLPWFWMGMAAVFLLSVTLRFWGLSRFNTLVFDEVYYAIFANNYLTRTQFFDGHPPLSKYIIAVGMWIGGYLPFGQDSLNSLTGSVRSSWSYRWLNALTGSFIPLVVAGIAYQLSHRRSYAFIAALFAAADGLFLVESRYALNNVYLVIFALLGQWFFLLGLEHHGRRRGFWLALSGIGFGASASIKWNGLWFLLGAYLIWIAAWGFRWVAIWRERARTKEIGRWGDREMGSTSRFASLADGAIGRVGEAYTNLSPPPHHPITPSFQTPLQNLTQLNVLHILFYLAIIPALIYSIEWIPHLQLNPVPGFWEVQKQILGFHARVGDGVKVHPYCSQWYTWLLMIRPVAYFYQTAQTIGDPLPVMGPPLPAGAGKVIYDVHAIGNPILWWLSTAAVLFFLWVLVWRIWMWTSRQSSNASRFGGNWQNADTWIALYLVLNWLANLLPWVRVTRCTFLYHYMGSSVFAGLALAWLVDQGLHSYRRGFRALSVTAIFLIFLALIFWMPIYLGLPLSPEGYTYRMWFRSWV